jgi:flagellar protein FliJ
MSTKAPALDQVRDLMQMRADDAATHLRRLLDMEKEAAGRLTLLRQYRDEYRITFMAKVQEGLSHEAWRNYATFLNRLEDAISQQEELARNSTTNVDQGKSAWLTHRNRVKAIDMLAQRHQNRMQLVANRREQKALDEYASRVMRVSDD